MDRHRLEPARLNELLDASGRWPHGRLDSVEQTRIGEEYGFSGGAVYRLAARTASGPVSLVAKFGDHAGVERAQRFHRDAGNHLTGHIPELFAAESDGEEGLMLLEDIGEATQGDDLVGCSPNRAGAVVDIVAELHAATWRPAGERPADLVGWTRPAPDPARWRALLDRATSRYPKPYESYGSRLDDLPGRAAGAVGALASGPTAWVHHDPHLDNVLFRGDDTPVLLDWSEAATSHPAFDVAALLVGYSLRDDAALEPADLIDRYTDVLDRNGVAFPDVADAAQLAMLRLVQGMISWQGARSDDPGRKRQLRDSSVARVEAAVGWMGR